MTIPAVEVVVDAPQGRESGHRGIVGDDRRHCSSPAFLLFDRLSDEVGMTAAV